MKTYILDNYFGGIKQFYYNGGLHTNVKLDYPFIMRNDFAPTYHRISEFEFKHTQHDILIELKEGEDITYTFIESPKPIDFEEYLDSLTFISYTGNVLVLTDDGKKGSFSFDYGKIDGDDYLDFYTYKVVYNGAETYDYDSAGLMVYLIRKK